MTRRSSKKPTKNNKEGSKSTSPSFVDWQDWLTDPSFRQTGQQILALIVIAVGIITLLALFEVTRGVWINPWTEALRTLFGWGAYPVGVSITLAGLLWLQHHLDQPLKWRWRPLIGVELVFFCLLPLTHIIVGGDSWGLVERGQGGGLIGWAISFVFVQYLSLPIAVIILSGLLSLGLGLAFDLTVDDARWIVRTIREAFAPQGTMRPTGMATTKPMARRQQSAQQRTPGQTAPRQSPPPRRPTQPSRVRVPPRPRSTPSTAPGAKGKPAPSTPSPPPAAPREYKLPTLSLLDEPEGPVLTDTEIRQKSQIIEETLKQFGLPVEVAEVRVGPTVTQFGVRPGFVERSGATSRKVRVNQISTLADDLALALAASRLRVEAPVPGRAIVGIEVPNNKIQRVSLREVMSTEDFDELDTPLAIALGHDVAGEPVATDLAQMPHLLIAGTTGSGKSVCIKAMITCLIQNNTPQQMRLVLIDPKMVELVRFNGLPHLYGQTEVELERIVKVLRWVALEMDSRYKQFAAATARNIDDYNRQMKKQEKPTLPRIVVLIDELADLMMLAPDEVERTICRIAQMARATGIHLVVATQRPSTDVVTGLIKANFPARISFATASQTDSRVILDMAGAETLLGKGDMLFLASDAGYPARVQGCFVSEEEIDRVTAFWRQQGGSPAEAPWEKMIRSEEETPEKDEQDELLPEAIELVRKRGSASASLLQRRLHIGHPRAARLMKAMEDMGIIGPPQTGGRRRRVIIGGEE